MSGYFFCNLSGDEEDTVQRKLPSPKISTSTNKSNHPTGTNTQKNETIETAEMSHSREIPTTKILDNKETTNSTRTSQKPSQNSDCNPNITQQHENERGPSLELPLHTTHHPENSKNDHHSANEVSTEASADSSNESQSHTVKTIFTTPQYTGASRLASCLNNDGHQSESVSSQLRGRLALVHQKQQHNRFLHGAKNETDETMTPENCLKRLSQHNQNLLNMKKQNDQKLMFLSNSISDKSRKGNLTLMNLSRCEFSIKEATLISSAIMCNPHLGVLKLSYNHLGDKGTAILAHAINPDGQNHHRSLHTLDLSFNSITDVGCIALAANAVSKNFALMKLYLCGNSIGRRGALAISAALINGCSLTSLSLAANQIGSNGSKALTRAIAECDVRLRYVREGNDPKNIGIDPALNDISKFKAVEKLILASNFLGCSGCLSISNMILTNSSLRVLCLCNNSVGNRELALLSQAISRNKNVPLQIINLSFNVFSCAGLESLMNAVWGSKTLKELRLDNNRIADRGAQLAAVVLGSVKLTVLDLGFNKIGNIGIKALMKSLSENDSLKFLSLSGNSFDNISSKALSYALAYNRSLNELNVDTCQMSHIGKRHVAAGIVSNGYLNLRVLSGIKLGDIVVTLGFPSACQSWTNEKVLTFVRIMWNKNNMGIKNFEKNKTPTSAPSAQPNNSTMTNDSNNPNTNRGPINPNMVVTIANKTYASLDDDNLGKNLLLSRFQAADSVKSLSPNTPLLIERSTSGLPLFHPMVEYDKDIEMHSFGANAQTKAKAPSYLGRNEKLNNTESEHLDRLENFDWQKKLIYCIAEIANIPYVEEELNVLLQHYFSAHTLKSDKLIRVWSSCHSSIHTMETFKRQKSDSALVQTAFERQVQPCYQKKINMLQRSVAGKRRSISTLVNESQSNIPTLKRPRSTSFHDKVDEFPRIKQYLQEESREKTEALQLLRRLKFLEKFCFTNYFSDDKTAESEKKRIFYSSSEMESCLLDWMNTS